MKKAAAILIALALLSTGSGITHILAEPVAALNVTAVGCGSTGESMHDFGAAYYFYINFDKELAADYADHITIGGKTLTAWGDPAGWGSCALSADRKSLEIYSFKGAGLGIAPDRDAAMIFDSGLKAEDGAPIAKAQKFAYSASSNNAGNWVEDTSYEEPVAALNVLAVGCGSTGESMHDFGTAYYFYINFDKELASDYADHITIGGKTLTAWGDPAGWGSCALSADRKTLEIYSFKGAGLGIAPDRDAVMIFDSGLKAEDGAPIAKAQKFVYSASSNNAGNWVEDTSYEEPVAALSVTAVGCGSTGESMHDFGTAYYFYINFDKELASDYADHITIGGKTLTAWGDPAGWGSCALSADRKTLEIYSFKGAGLGIAPDRDAAMIFDSGLKAEDGAPIAKAQKFVYSASSNNAGNWVEDTSYEENPEPFVITSVGSDGTGEGMHAFDATYYFAVTFSKAVSDSCIQYLSINGKTIQEWGDPAGWGSYTLSADGKLLEIHSFKGAGLGLAPSKDAYMAVGGGFQSADGTAYSGKKQYVYYKSSNNAGNWVEDEAYTPPGEEPEPDEYDVSKVGCWSTGESFHDFGGTWFFMMEFTGGLYSPNQDQFNLQSQYGNLIKINGKMLAQHNAVVPNNITVHYRADGEKGHLEFHISKAAYPVLTEKDMTVVIMENLKSAKNESLPDARKYVYKASQNNQGNFVRDLQVTDEDKKITGSDDEPFSVKLVGVPDQNEGIHDFGAEWYFRVYFNRALYSANINYPLVQEVWGKYFRINGKTVEQWNQAFFGAVILMYVGADNNSGCFEVKINAVAGIISDITVENVTFDILPGLKAADRSVLSAGQRFEYRFESENRGNWIEILDLNPDDFKPVEGSDNRYPDPNVAPADYEYEYRRHKAENTAGMSFTVPKGGPGPSGGKSPGTGEAAWVFAGIALALCSGALMVLIRRGKTAR